VSLFQQIDELLCKFYELRNNLRDYDKYLFEKWKAGGFDISGEFVSVYPSLPEIAEILEREQESLDNPER